MFGELKIRGAEGAVGRAPHTAAELQGESRTLPAGAGAGTRTGTGAGTEHCGVCTESARLLAHLLNCH